jgi:hypothetical protein
MVRLGISHKKGNPFATLFYVNKTLSPAGSQLASSSEILRKSSNEGGFLAFKSLQILETIH